METVDCSVTYVSPVNQWVILAPIVLYLEHPNAWNIPLEVELDQCCGRCGLSCHHPLIHSTLYISCHVAPICSASGRRRNVWWPRVRLLDVIGVVGDVREFYNNQVNSLVSFTSGVGGDAGEGASVFHSTDEDVQSPIIVDQCSGGVRYQFTLRRNPVDGWFWVTSCLTPKTRQSTHIRGFTSSKQNIT